MSEYQRELLVDARGCVKTALYHRHFHEYFEARNWLKEAAVSLRQAGFSDLAAACERAR